MEKIININNFKLTNFTELSEDQILKILKWRNDERVSKWMFTENISKEEHLNFVSSLKNRDDKEYYLVSDKNGIDIGVINLYDIDKNARKCYWGNYSDPENIGSGQGIILEYLVLELVFLIKEFNCLRCETLDINKNVVSSHLFLGFVKEGILRDFIYKDDKYFDVIVTGILKSEWENKKCEVLPLIERFF